MAATEAPTSAKKELKSEQEIIEAFNSLRQEQQLLMSRIAETEGERHEHALVVDTLTPLETTRTCHRLVGGVLVQRTVGEVLPMIKASLEKFDDLLKQFNETLVTKERETTEFMIKYKIQYKGQQGAGAPQQSAQQPAQQGRTQGVLA